MSVHKKEPLAYTEEDLAELESKKTASVWSVTKLSVKPRGGLYMSWLLLVVLVFVYNCIMVPYRIFFMLDHHGIAQWMVICDYFGDMVNIIDLVLVKPRLCFVNENDGCWTHDLVNTFLNYCKSPSSKFDLMAVLPFGTLELYSGPSHFYRLNRMVKVAAYRELLQTAAASVSNPLIFRVLESLGYMLLMIHTIAGAYFLTSKQFGLGTDKWVFSGEGNAYLHCFYFATKTALSIGRNVKPTNTLQYLFMAVSWLSGVFVFASLLGQVHDNIEMSVRAQEEYRKTSDKIYKLLQDKGVPQCTCSKVRTWLDFTWKQNHRLDEDQLWRNLPRKLHTDLASAVHWHTISRTKILSRCPIPLLRELCQHVRPITFLPGDYVIVRGMRVTGFYIVGSGHLQALRGGGDAHYVTATLSEGSVFGVYCADSTGHTFNSDVDIRCVAYCTVLFLNSRTLSALVEDYRDEAPHLQLLSLNKHT